MSDDIIHDGIPGSVRSMSCGGAESSVPELIPAVPVPGVRGGASLSHHAVSMPRNPALHIFCQDYHAPAPAPLWVVMVAGSEAIHSYLNSPDIHTLPNVSMRLSIKVLLLHSEHVSWPRATCPRVQVSRCPV